VTSQIFQGRTLIVAFEGWNDAAESASGAAKFIVEKPVLNRLPRSTQKTTTIFSLLAHQFILMKTATDSWPGQTLRC